MFVREISVAASSCQSLFVKGAYGKEPVGPWWEAELKPIPNNDFSSCIGAYGLENNCANVLSIDNDRFLVTQYSICNEIKSICITHYFNKSSNKFVSVLCGIFSLKDWNEFCACLEKAFDLDFSVDF